nr:translation initiation factor IF-2-like [Chlorocebus sabaeus]XP_037863214.1 translation initiation factor IF-2-like [Chlorocebus sabaeus]
MPCGDGSHLQDLCMCQSKMPGSGNQSGGPLGPAVPSPGSHRVGLPQGYGRVSAWAQKDSGGPQFTPTSLFQVPLLERGPGSAEVRRGRCSGQEPAESRDPSRAGRSHSATCRPRAPRSSARAGRLRGAGERVRPRGPPAGPGQGSQSEAGSAASGGSWRGAGGTAWGGAGQSPPRRRRSRSQLQPQPRRRPLSTWAGGPQPHGPKDPAYALAPAPAPALPAGSRGVVPHSCSTAPASPCPPCPTGTPPGWPRPPAEDSLAFTGDKVETGVVPAARPGSCSQGPEPGPLPCTPVLDAPSLDMGVSSTRTVHGQGRGTRAEAGQRYRLKGRAGVPDPAAVLPD